jgi:zinc D-Ala-D-Ala carboxypeptidase
MSVQELARRVQRHAAITTAETHVSGHADDGATAANNIDDAANGNDAHRSSYTDGANTGPGGTVALDEEMLEGMLTLADEYNFRVSEIAGGVHGDRSRHYAGVAFDIDRLNQRAVNSSNPDFQAFMTRGTELGATEVLGPGDASHETHVHLAWPRNLTADVQKDDAY